MATFADLANKFTAFSAIHGRSTSIPSQCPKSTHQAAGPSLLCRRPTHPALPNLTTGLTPSQTGHTPHISPHFAATLGRTPSEAATTTIGFEHAGGPPVDAPPPGDQFGGSFVDQNLALADSRPGATRGSPHTHSPTHGSIPQFPASPSHAPTWVESPPALDGQPDGARPPPSIAFSVHAPARPSGPFIRVAPAAHWGRSRFSWAPFDPNFGAQYGA
ncbi:hypothetical protein Adt_44781 [Abeliophyllum distichum]|uniref:Uncharacterized protein n=1 Tax=Abeliophyllum distichum TaxID=126358 RepID=A0ABD1PBU5_9LAMI